ncbi:MAG: Gfo/Idh/MocA family oxidoreductase [Candidatus Latescibacterota bacterium]
MLRFGLIGCGTHARWAVGPAFQQCRAVHLAAVADVSAESLQRFAWPDAGLARFADWREMIRREALDAVWVATPCEAHLEPVLAALAAGLHVATEKPMAPLPSECERMVAAAQAAGRVLAVDFESRYHPAFRRIQAWVQEGRLGRVHAVHMNEMWDGHKVFGPLADRRRRFTDTSGALDCGIHHLDLVRYFCGGGRFQDIHATGAWFGEDVRFPPHIAIQARLDRGVVVTMNSSFAYTAYIEPRDLHDTIVLVGTEGVVDFRRDTKAGEDTVRLTSNSLTETQQFPTQGHAAVIPRLLTDFTAVVEAGIAWPPALATGQDGLMAQVIVHEANQQSVAHGDACRLG